MDSSELLWRELHDCRQDERHAQASLVTILIGSSAVYGAIGYLLYGPNVDRSKISDVAWFIVPLIPMALTGWFCYLVSQIVVRGRYLELLEHSLREEVGVVVDFHDDPVRSIASQAQGKLAIPAAHGLLLPIGSVVRGHRRMGTILIMGLAYYQILPLGLVLLALANISGLVLKMLLILAYVPFFVLTSYTIGLNGLFGGRVWGRSLATHHSRVPVPPQTRRPRPIRVRPPTK